jgi:protein tyrosine phosphatase (PTP) superfamily phosphohydrolase (DUF442 family)
MTGSEAINTTGSASSPTVPPAAKRRRRRIVRWAILTAAAGGLLIGGYYAYLRLVTTNFHEVVPGQVYRSAQPSPEQVRQWVPKYGLKTIVNLRHDAWKTGIESERQAAQEAGAQFVNVRWSDRELPPRETVLQLVAVLENSPRPILLHCKAGADRAGVASVMAAMAIDGQRYDSARKQLSILYLHVWDSPDLINGLLGRYEQHCRDKGRGTGGWKEFRRWATEDYNPG